MSRPAHQDIDDLAASLHRRAELEGISRGLRLRSARQFTRWLAFSLFGLAAALAIGWSVPSLWWLPLAALAFAALSLTLLTMRRMRLQKMIEQARHRRAG